MFLSFDQRLTTPLGGRRGTLSAANLLCKYCSTIQNKFIPALWKPAMSYGMTLAASHSFARDVSVRRR
jgi:hypothetical protein